MTSTKTRVALKLALAFLTSHASADSGSWPPIAPTSETFRFDDGAKASARVTLRSPAGDPLYLLQCHAKGYEGDPEFDYSGDFECRLKSLYSKERYSTLLTDRRDQRRDWESRGRFLVEELVGRCAEYPEFGRLRNFDLRGMRLSLEVSDLVIVQPSGPKASDKRPQIKSFTFNVVVQPNSNAKGSIAANVKYVEPPYLEPNNPSNLSRNCDKILQR